MNPQQRWKHGDLTEKIIGAFYDVYNVLGYGFLEKVYENALAHRLRQAGLHVETQHPLKVYFDGIVVGEYFADLIVEGKVILEIKAVERLAKEHSAQLRNYLRATDCEVGLVLNFGPEPQFARQIMDNALKPKNKA